jgi:hypothetical protein
MILSLSFKWMSEYEVVSFYRFAVEIICAGQCDGDLLQPGVAVAVGADVPPSPPADSLHQSGAAVAISDDTAYLAEPLATDASLRFLGNLEATAAAIRTAGAVLLPPASAHCDLQGDGLSGCFIGQPSVLKLTLRDADRRPVSNLPLAALAVTLLPVPDEEDTDEDEPAQRSPARPVGPQRSLSISVLGLPVTITPVDPHLQPGVYSLSYTIGKVAHYRLNVTVNGEPVLGSPWAIRSRVAGRHCSATGDGLQSCVNRVPTTITVLTRDPLGAPVSHVSLHAIEAVLDEDAQANTVVVTHGPLPGVFNVTYTTTLRGFHRLSLRINGDPVPLMRKDRR